MQILSRDATPSVNTAAKRGLTCGDSKRCQTLVSTRFYIAHASNLVACCDMTGQDQLQSHCGKSPRYHAALFALCA
jgi:hypothetical protein